MTPPEPLLIGRSEAAQVLGISARLLDAWNSDGTLGPRDVSPTRRVLFRYAELRDWVDAGMPPRREWQQLTSTLKDHEHA